MTMQTFIIFRCICECAIPKLAKSETIMHTKAEAVKKGGEDECEGSTRGSHYRHFIKAAGSQSNYRSSGISRRVLLTWSPPRKQRKTTQEPRTYCYLYCFSFISVSIREHRTVFPSAGNCLVVPGWELPLTAEPASAQLSSHSAAEIVI